MFFFQRQSSLLFRKRLVVPGTALAVGTGALCYYYWPDIKFLGNASRRSLYVVFTASQILFDYKKNFPGPQQVSILGQSEWSRMRGEVHKRCAERMLALFQTNSGIYIKIGQHISALDYLIPAEYCKTLAILHKNAPQSSLEDVITVIETELGQDYKNIYSVFNPTPIGSASLAQVHHAIIKATGEHVAVKVQHKKLEAFVDLDMFTISTTVRAAKRIFPEFDFDWLVAEMRTNLPLEMDFINEGLNAERVYKNFKYNSSIPLTSSDFFWTPQHLLRIPKIHWKHTSKRVLTMEYLDGQVVTNSAFLKDHNIDPSQVSTLITKVFSEMIFSHGFVHCDPHPGNLLIRPRAAQKPLSLPFPLSLFQRPRGWELILLDHGLYRDIPEDFRLNYARLWMAILSSDEVQIKEYAESIGGKDAHRLFSCILTQRSWDSVSQGNLLGTQKSAEESLRIRKRAPEFLAKVADLLSKLPRPLLLLLKTNDLLRHLERSLLAASGNANAPSMTFIIMAHYCIDAVGVGWLDRLTGIYLHLKLHILSFWLQCFSTPKSFMPLD